MGERSENSLLPVTADPFHPANGGRLCGKGASLHETLGTTGRLLRPRIHGQEVTWNQALDAVAQRLDQVRRTRGSGAIGFYLSGQLLTEDYYVANKLAKGFLGTPHVDTNSRLCMSSAVAAHKRAFGADLVPGCYEDLELADLLVITGANPAWNHPVLFQRMRQASRPGRRVVVIDPRVTASCDLADLHLRLRPGSDTLLFNGLLVWLADHQALDRGYLERHVQDWQQTLATARHSAPDTATVAEACDLGRADLERFYQWFAQTPRSVTFFSQGVNQAVDGTDKANAIINAHLATGRVGQPGASPFSITGQPNAMGGREVGGLANQLAAHLDYSDPGARALVQEFWQAPALPEQGGLKAVDLFEAVADGRIQALWIMATNPVVSLPEADRVKKALAACPNVIVSDCMAHSDTLALADIALPAAGWPEKDGTVTNSERRISRQRALLPPTAQARPDWWIISQVARRLGHADAFQYQHPGEIFREHARLTHLARRLPGDNGQLDLGALAQMDLRDYDQLQPTQWPITPQCPEGTARLFSNGRFCTPDGRARMVPIRPATPTTASGLMLNTGRLRDQWHSMTRSGRAPRLLQHHAEPFVAIHPVDAEQLALVSGDLVQLRGAGGHYIGRAEVTDDQRPGEVFLPIHWNAQFSKAGRVGSLLIARTDPVSGQPALKMGDVGIQRLTCRWQARLLCRSSISAPEAAHYWTRVPLQNCQAWHLAGEVALDWPAMAAQWLGGHPTLMLQDSAPDRFRAARLDREGRLESVMLVSPDNTFPQLDWLDRQFRQPSLPLAARRQLLAGFASYQPDPGTIICSCHQVGRNPILDAIRDGAHSLEGLGARLRCGTQCGSCIPELKALLATAQTAVSPTSENA